MPDAQTMPQGPALFRYPEYDETTRKLNHDVPGVVVTVLHPYAYDVGQPHHVVRCADGSEMAVRSDQLTPLDAGELEACALGFVRALMWTDAQPFGKTCGDCGNTIDDDSRGHDEDCASIGQPGTFDRESGGLENSEPTPELLAQARVLCARFLTAAKAEDVEAFMDAYGDPDGGHPCEYVGHTFYLDAAGHGVSFTDRAWRDDDPMTAVCERLRDVAQTFREVEHIYAYELSDGTVGL